MGVQTGYAANQSNDIEQTSYQGTVDATTQEKRLLSAFYARGATGTVPRTIAVMHLCVADQVISIASAQ